MTAMNNKGISNIVVMILTALALISLFTYYFLSGEVKDIDEKIKNEGKRQDEIEENKRQITTLIIDLSPLILPVGVNEQIDPTAIDKYVSERKKQLKLIGSGGEVTMEKIVRDAIDNATSSRIKLERATYEKDVSNLRQAKMKDFISLVKEKKDEEISALKNQRNDLNDKLSSETDKYEVLKNNLTSLKKQQDDRLPQMKNSFELDKTRVQNDIALIKYNLDELTAKEVFNRDVVENQGKIIQPNVMNRFAFISLGSKDNIKLGWKFMVYRRDKAGIRQWKGQVEVKQIYDNHSLASITALKDPLDPIAEGDAIANIFYHPVTPRFVVLIGKMERGDFKYAKPELERRLADLGVNVEKKVSLKTDFVIIGKDPEETDVDRNNYIMVKTMNIPRLENADAREALEFYLGD